MKFCAATFSMSKRKFSVLAAVIGLMLLSLAYGQEKPARLTFDVAVIRPSDPGARGGGIKRLPGGNGYLVQNVPVKAMISLMYKVPGRQITGGPDWLNNQVCWIVRRSPTLCRSSWVSNYSRKRDR